MGHRTLLMKLQKRTTMEKNSTSFVNAYFDTKKDTMENPAKEKQKIKPLEQLHLSQIHQHILPADAILRYEQIYYFFE
jgi:hypothetical protein